MSRSEPEVLPDVLLVGASTRAIAQSALRSFRHPWCIDRYADEDLRSTAAHVVVASTRDEIRAALATLPSMPVCYTGAVENDRSLVALLERHGPLWGNPVSVLRRARNPWFVTDTLRAAGLPVPAIAPRGTVPPPDGRWIRKPLRSAAGRAVAVWDATAANHPLREPHWFQERIDGEPHSALFVGFPRDAVLVGTTRQLVGRTDFHAPPFAWCGSVGPVAIAPEARSVIEAIGRCVARACGLRGLFGIDFLLRDAVPWLAEINPRYPASTEIYELAWTMPLLHWHQVACEAFAAESVDDDESHRTTALHATTRPHVADESHASAESLRSIVAKFVTEGATEATCAPRHAAVGKAILYSPGDFVFPHEAERDAFTGSPDWHAAKPVGGLQDPESGSRRASATFLDRLSMAVATTRLPRLADVPRPGTIVPAGYPVCSVLVAAKSDRAVEAGLGEAVARLSESCRAAGRGTGTPVGRS